MSGAAGIVSMVLGMVGGAYAGSEQKDMYKSQAGMAKDDANLLKWESEREALVTREEGRRFAKEQAMAYVSSGVQLEGSALLTVTETVKLSETEARAIEYRGNTQYNSKMRESELLTKQGKAAFVSSVFGSTGQAVQTYSSLYGKK